ncbi:hypothetical protein AB0A77_06715 [Streptomyces varsoviensis]|uniref:hypothetical protein n=1 Tax=Streptomyces varsoviensis TaxID=67373 RepID=UPI0033CD278B
MAEAVRATRPAGFGQSCTEQVGRLLSTLAPARPGGRIAESGTGCGVAAVGLSPDAVLFTVERNEERAAVAEGLFRDDDRVRVLCGQWTLTARTRPLRPAGEEPKPGR